MHLMCLGVNTKRHPVIWMALPSVTLVLFLEFEFSILEKTDGFSHDVDPAFAPCEPASFVMDHEVGGSIGELVYHMRKLGYFKIDFYLSSNPLDLI